MFNSSTAYLKQKGTCTLRSLAPTSSVNAVTTRSFSSLDSGHTQDFIILNTVDDTPVASRSLFGPDVENARDFTRTGFPTS
mmetsp:Transcript_46797/g.92093  ORF Transcript_46797/g.92093 Transcript_46797/m.92093 type:complete len:81 (-) Transcript_46797:122-364(-)